MGDYENEFGNPDYDKKKNVIYDSNSICTSNVILDCDKNFKLQRFNLRKFACYYNVPADQWQSVIFFAGGAESF